MNTILKFAIPCIFIFLLASCFRKVKEHNAKFVMIDYQYSPNNELNTFNDTFREGLSGSGSMKIKFWLSKDDQDEIINNALTHDFFLLPDTINFNEPGNKEQPDTNIYYLRIKYKKLDKKVVWIGNIPDNLTQYNGFAVLTELIQKIIRSRPEYKALPDKNAGFFQYVFQMIKFYFT